MVPAELECPDDEWPEDPVVRQLLTLGAALVSDLASGRARDDVIRNGEPGPELPRVAALYDDTRLGVSAAALARQIAEEGTHDLLMASGGLYADLYTLQASAYDTVRPA